MILHLDPGGGAPKPKLDKLVLVVLSDEELEDWLKCQGQLLPDQIDLILAKFKKFKVKEGS